jgi:hypothetical protein
VLSCTSLHLHQEESHFLDFLFCTRFFYLQSPPFSLGVYGSPRA